MVRPDDIANIANQKWFDSLAGFGDWMVTILGSIVALGGLYLMYVYMEHRIKVTWFPIYGGDKQLIKAVETEEELKALDVTLGHPRKARARQLKDKGVRKVSLLNFPNIFKPKKIKDIPHTLIYPDGMWLIKITNDKYIPIERPIIDNSVHLTAPDPDMDLWQEAAETKLRLLTRNEGDLKKHLYMTAAIILGAFVLSGIIIWLSMSFAGNSINAALDKMDGFSGAIQGMLQSNAPG